jgi:predicted nucleic acid-binding protein
LATQHYHLDTNYLLGYLLRSCDLGDAEDREAHRVINRIFYKGDAVVVSEFVFGELLHVLRRDYKKEVFHKLVDHLYSKDFFDDRLKVFRVESDGLDRLASHVNEIRHADSRLQSNDVIITDFFLCDETSKWLLTFDNDLVSSRGLAQLLESHNKHIGSTPFRR